MRTALSLAVGVCLGLIIAQRPTADAKPRAPAKKTAASKLTESATRRVLEGFTLDVLRVKDGDTLVANVHFPWGLGLFEQDIRTDYDAWEISRRRKTVKVDEAEIAKGERATADLQQLLDSAQRVYVLPPAGKGRDPYGRLLALLYCEVGGEQIHVAEWMEARGHVRNRPAPSEEGAE